MPLVYVSRIGNTPRTHGASTLTIRPNLRAALLLLGSSVVALSAADTVPAEKAKPKFPFAHDCAVGSVAFAADGIHVVSGADDGFIRVWNRETGEEVRRLTGHRGPRLLVVLFARR